MAGTFTPIETKHRRIVTEIPAPQSVPLIEALKAAEPRSMSGMPPIVWDHADGFQVYDAWGNCWIDFTSAVILANVGHSHPVIGVAIRRQLDAKLWHNYCNPSEVRLATVRTLGEILPPYLDKVFLLTTGSEAVECAIKLTRLHGRSISPEKLHIVSYYGSFHGRTMAAQAAGGFMDQQEWMGLKPAGFHHIPFPECARCPWGKEKYENCGRECLERSLTRLREQGVQDELIAGVIVETFQGPFVAFMPVDYAQALREWTVEHRALLVFDEMQAGLGRTGKWFGFEHYGVEPDLVCLGKGITSSLPLSTVAGRAVIMDRPEPGEMSSTHTGNPLCCAAAMANIQVTRDEHLVERAASLEPTVRSRFEGLRNDFPRHVGSINGKGLVWAVHLMNPETSRLDPDLAGRVTTRCMELGLLMLQTHRGTLKIAPPLCITEEALLEGIEVIGTALKSAIDDCRRRETLRPSL